jgi:hypothetical protein
VPVPWLARWLRCYGTLSDVDDTKADEPGSLAVAPRPQHPRDNWLEFLGAGAAGGFANAVGTDVYNDVKVACRAAVEQFRDRRSDPDEEQVWMHQLVAEASIGPCPPGQKLVHLNGDGLDNRRANLAYVPESDPRPAAPLAPRPPGWVKAPVSAGQKTVSTGNKRSKGKKKHR